MKVIILLPFALLFGMLIGSWPLRTDVARLNSELAEARALLKKQPGRAGTMNEFTSLLGIERSRDPEPAAVDTSASSRTNAVTPSATNAPATSLSTNSTEDITESPATPAEPRTAGPGMERDIDTAVELWKVRVDVARSTFVSNARLDDQETVAFDVLVEAMNLRIGDTIDNFANQLRDAEEVQMEAGIRIMNEITDAIVLTYDEMDDALPNEWRENSGQKFSLLNFIDPEVARPLSDVQDKLDMINQGQP